MPKIPKYCIDTSSYITAWCHHYSPAIFESLWKKVGEALNQGIIISPREVLDELERGSDELLKWAKLHKAAFIELEEKPQKILSEIMKSHPKIIDLSIPEIQADPYVIALAKHTDTIIVTEEKSAVDSKKKLKIPDVAKNYKVNCVPFSKLIEMEGWKF
ncbi:DUF4411 family protein [Leptospira dzoumogneensis]|uniref:DUF4411 family protein n=1 Tax=Leptospira dzoumogneensis TaxID=2484904 RepID=A0A4Z1A8E9_9LEPT|nr:DUF4411 family protein [Leptospira dzoumogneensis]TGM95491.1 DUF4411 family protein [Leptospira dzoumogneensis]